MPYQPQIEPRLLRSPDDFEVAAADWMRAWGLHQVRPTPVSRDGGIDVESVEAVAQVKAWMVPVGSPEVQQLKGAAYDGRVALFFSLMEYTAAAVQFANKAGVALFRFSGYNGEVEPVNACAREFIIARAVTPCDLDSVSDEARGQVYQLVADSLQQVIDLGPGAFGILYVKGTSRTLQFVYVDGPLRMTVETFDQGNVLRACEIARLGERGWYPTKFGDGQEAYYIDFPGPPFSKQGIAELITRTLIEVHGIQNVEDIDVDMETGGSVLP